MDPILSLAKRRVIADSAEIEAQFAIKDGCRPIVTMLQLARSAAADALSAIIDMPPHEAIEITRLQNEVKRYRDMIGWLSKIVTDGIEADKELSDAEKAEMVDALLQTPEGEQEAIDRGYIEGVPSDGIAG